MANKFHMKPNGAISRCDAQAGGCPFGGESGQENHYSSVREAREAFEAANAGKTVPSVRKTAEAPPAPVKAAEPRKATPRRRKKAATPPQDPWQQPLPTTREDLIHLVEQDKMEEAEARHQVEVYRYVPQVMAAFATSPSARISEETKREALRHLVASSTKDADEVFTGEVARRAGGRIRAAYSSFDGRGKARVAQVTPDLHTQELIYSDIKESPSGLERDTKAIALWKNPSLYPEMKERLHEMVPAVASMAKWDEAERKDPEGLKNLVKSSSVGDSVYGPNSATARESYHLDAEKLKEHGLDSFDVHTYMVHRQGRHLHGASYDAASAVYSGYRG